MVHQLEHVVTKVANPMHVKSTASHPHMSPVSLPQRTLTDYPHATHQGQPSMPFDKGYILSMLYVYFFPENPQTCSCTESLCNPAFTNLRKTKNPEYEYQARIRIFSVSSHHCNTRTGHKIWLPFTKPYQRYPKAQPRLPSAWLNSLQCSTWHDPFCVRPGHTAGDGESLLHIW